MAAARACARVAPFRILGKSPMRPFILTLLFILLAVADRAAAFICTLSPDKSTVIVKVSNPYAQQTACTVTCNFITPDGIKSVTCTQTVPGGAKDWYVCIHPAAGKSYSNLDSGSENCTKP
jgi:hypothetical protein